MYRPELYKASLASREAARRSAEDLARPYTPFIGAGLISSGHGATFDRRTTELELVSRLLWGAAASSDSGNTLDEVNILLRNAIINGSDPGSPDYWGEPGDFSQALVEMPGIAFAMLERPRDYWDPLHDKQRESLLNWLEYVNKRKLPECNWRLFPFLVNAVFSMYAPERMNAPLMRELIGQIDSFYLSGGWYNDGNPTLRRSRDYYSPWAYHYFALLFVSYMPDFDPGFTRRVSERAGEFAYSYSKWFHEDGSALPYGRSLSYRFAQAAFWAACAKTGLEVLPWDKIRRLWTSNLSWWLSKPMFTDGGLLSVGYSYPNLFMSERYNSPASPLWAMQAFVHLNSSSGFWDVQASTKTIIEAPADIRTEPSARAKTEAATGSYQLYSQSETGMLLCNTGTEGHLYAACSGQWTPGDANAHNHFAEKYEKFCYSTKFGFNVSIDEEGLDKIAPDNSLLLSLDGLRYYRKRESVEHEVGEDRVSSTWMPLPGVKVVTVIRPMGVWHVREHRIESDLPLTLLEGGFPLPYDPDVDLKIPEDGSLGVSRFGAGGIVDAGNARSNRWINAAVNSNIMYPRTWIPILEGRITKGSHVLRTAVLADAQVKTAAEAWSLRTDLNTAGITL